jgi:hypothetical protein
MNTDEIDIGLWVMTDNGYYNHSRYQTSTKNSIDLNRPGKSDEFKAERFRRLSKF